MRVALPLVLSALGASAAVAAAPAPPAFSASVERVTAADLPYSWRRGCPVGPAQLRLVQLRFWGFDQRAHTGRLVIAASAADDVVAAFRKLYEARFPNRRMEPVDVFHGSDNASMAADNTSGFNCRYAVATGPKRWSSHAFGTAIDVNTVENPYLLGGVVRPRKGAAYLDRSRHRAGMAFQGGVLVRAFASVGWGWGGTWSGSPDYQHFSVDGR
jgi:hypothetical protein